MSKTTTNYNLIKPELTDPADITVTNGNWDTIDAELANKAPAGYGLGTTPNRTTAKSDLDTYTNTGWYAYYNPNDELIPGYEETKYGAIRVDGDASGKSQTFFPRYYPMCTLIRTKVSNGAWGEWEWDNPPMRNGFEYRTTERIGLITVYKRRIANGAIEYRLDGETEWKPYADAVGALHSGNTNKSSLVSTDTTPTTNNEINWTYK